MDTTTHQDTTPLLDDLPGAGRLLGGTSRSTLYRLIERGELDAVKLGSRTFITRDSIVALIERRTMAHAS